MAHPHARILIDFGREVRSLETLTHGKQLIFYSSYNMLRAVFSVVVGLLCWGRLSLGFVVPCARNPIPSSGRNEIILHYSNVILEEQKEALKTRLPPIKRHGLSKMEKEFRELLKAMLYTPQEMSSITNPRTRAIYEGVAASYYVPEVYRAFEVLYEDYLPLRLAGRVVHGKLQKIMDESKEYQQIQLEKVVSKTGFQMEDVLLCWESFVKMAGRRELSTDRIETLFRNDLDPNVTLSQNDDIMLIVNPKRQESLSFSELVDGFMALYPDFTSPMMQMLFLSPGHVVSPSCQLDDKQRKYSQRYDDMLVKFGEWKTFIPSGEGRRLDILRGCFVGSENKRVVEALRVIYTDYSALRMSGDWIFQVVSTLMNGVMNRRHQSQRKAP